MCFHDKPTRNDEINQVSPPPLAEGDEVVFDECGRCAPQVNGRGDLDYHSHHFRVVKPAHGEYALCVRHGGGDERFPIGYPSARVVEILATLDSDARYLMLYALYEANRNSVRRAAEKERHRWTRAAIDKKIKTRKVRGQDRVEVWIDG